MEFSDLFGLLSQLFQTLLPTLPPNVLNAIEGLTLVLTIIVSVWFANRNIIAKYLPNVIATTQFQFIDQVMEELRKEVGHTPTADLNDPKAVATLILDNDAITKI